jgi:hypothetical protein
MRILADDVRGNSAHRFTAMTYCIFFFGR